MPREVGFKDCQYPEGIDYLCSSCQVVKGIQRCFLDGCPVSKQRGNLFAITLENLKYRAKVQEAKNEHPGHSIIYA